MSETAAMTTPPAFLPVLSRGRHRNPARGACFMEYTALLAGEPFSDAPRCVDPELASVLRAANDALSDDERPALVPFLGRAIGLVVERPGGRARTVRSFRLRRVGRSGEAAVDPTARLHRLVSDQFGSAVGLPTSKTWSRWYRDYASVSELFWDLMSVPTTAETARDLTGRLVQRLDLLHRCYEEALIELGLPRRTGGPVEAEPDRAAAHSSSPAGQLR
jgi:hypothetical protein